MGIGILLVPRRRCGARRVGDDESRDRPRHWWDVVRSRLVEVISAFRVRLSGLDLGLLLAGLLAIVVGALFVSRPLAILQR